MTGRTIAVIGSSYGDEGKGRTVDDLLEGLEPSNAVVIRHNSSAQAGHTVVAGGQRHVFSHYGSGTLRGISSYLGVKFVVHPLEWIKEWQDLRALGVAPRLYCHPACRVTTPYDHAANQVREQLRDEERHGSVGIGFGETIGRHEAVPTLDIRVEDLSDRSLEKRLLAVRVHYARIFSRPALEGLASPAARLLLNPDPDLSKWIAQARAFLSQTEILRISMSDVPPKETTVIFEGAQGLMLDAELGAFPHVTRCKTGLADIAPLAMHLGRADIEAFYVTRCYATRHGAGPLAHEIDRPPVPKFEDKTNVLHAFQGELRFAPLDLDILADAIRLDIEDGRRRGLDVIPNLVITCIDQLDDTGCVPIVIGGRKQVWGIEFLATRLASMIGDVNRIVLTYGAQRGARHMHWERAAA